MKLRLLSSGPMVARDSQQQDVGSVLGAQSARSRSPHRGSLCRLIAYCWEDSPWSCASFSRGRQEWTPRGGQFFEARPDDSSRKTCGCGSRNRYTKWNPGKWKQRRKPVVPWWFNFDSRPCFAPSRPRPNTNPLRSR